MPTTQLTRPVLHSSALQLERVPVGLLKLCSSCALPRIAILFIVLLGSSADQLPAQLPVIAVRSLSQSFFAPGGVYEIGIAEGTQTEEVVELLVSHPGIRSELSPGTPQPYTNEATPRHGNFRIRVAEHVPVGRYEVRAVGRFGVSNSRAILVVGQTQAVTSAPHSVESAPQLGLGVLYHRCVSSAARDHYSLSVVAGKSYNVQLIGHSVDSRLIGAVSLVNSHGRTILSRIGSDQSDLTFSFVSEASETLKLIVHDALFRGGASYQYGLRVTQGNAPAYFEPAMLPKSITVDPLSSESIQADATERNDSAPFVVPFHIRAAFDDESDRRYYMCRLEQGKPVRIDVVSDRLGEPTNVRLIVERATGAGDARTWQRVITSEDSYKISDSVVRLGTADPVLDFQPPADGDYRISVIDLDSGSSLSASQRFSLRLAESKPDWQLLAYRVYPHKDANTSRPSGTQLLRGGGAVFRVFAIRKNMAAPIRVSIPELPEGLSCPPAWIAPNQSQVDLVITASPNAEAGIVNCRVVGEIENASSQDRREARYATVTWEQDGYRPFVKTRITDKLVFSVSDLDSYPITIGVGSNDPFVAKKGSKITLPIKLQRSEGGKQNVVLRARSLPPGVKAGDLTIPADKSEAQWTVDVSDKAASGKYSLWGQGETTVKFAANPQALTRTIKYLEELKSARADPNNAEKHSEIDKLIAETQKQVETLKKQTAARDFTVYVPTPLITLEIQ